MICKAKDNNYIGYSESEDNEDHHPFYVQTIGNAKHFYLFVDINEKEEGYGDVIFENGGEVELYMKASEEEKKMYKRYKKAWELMNR